MLVIGIDIGLSGGIATHDTETGEKDCFPMPPSKNYVEPWAMRREMERIVAGRKFICAIEKVGCRPGQGVVAMQNFGISAGVTMATVVGLSPVELMILRPQQWQQYIWGTYNGHGPDTKQKTYSAMLNVAPGLAPKFTTIRGKLLDGLCDASAICHYAVCQSAQSGRVL